MSTPMKSRGNQRSSVASIIGIASAIIILVGAAIGFISLHGLHSVKNTGATTSVQSQSSGLQMHWSLTIGTWTTSQGLPQRITNYSFSAQTPTIGYAAVLTTPMSQAIYKTTDAGTTWQKISNITASVGDYISIDPINTQDIVLLSGEIPAPGEYAIQRSYDGGITWSAQSTTLDSDAAVSQMGWIGSTFVVGFDMAGNQMGYAAVVAFPSKQNSFHLDVSDKIDATAITHITLISGTQKALQIWGMTNSGMVGFLTSDLGNHWTTLLNSASTTDPTPVAASANGVTVASLNTNNSQITIAVNGSVVLNMNAGANGLPNTLQQVFISADGKFVAIDGGDGMYLLHNGQWVKVTATSAAMLAENAAGQPRLWASNNQGQLSFQDD